jgi:molybdate/tungstate transport system substrate-binding protein
MNRYLIRSVKIWIILIFLFAGCSNAAKEKEVIIFHAGSLSVPFKQLAAEYNNMHPEINILLEPAGSLVCARKVTELKKPCDIVASADEYVIDQLLMPEYANWNIRFATNEIVIAYLDQSVHSSEISSDNWFNIISSDDVSYARSDPNSDPCGYRTVLTMKLAEKYYNKPDLAEKLQAKDFNFIRPKEVDLIALLESNAVDYIFNYKSVAKQHNLKYISLPDEINLSNPDYNNLYKSVSIEVTGSSSDSKMTITGEYINYSATVLLKAPHNEEAVNFLEFLLSPEGMEIFRKSGQDPIIPFSTEQIDLIPGKLKKHLKEPKL